MDDLSCLLLLLCFLNFCRRKLEHAIQKLRDPIEERKKKAEGSKRSLISKYLIFSSKKKKTLEQSSWIGVIERKGLKEGQKASKKKESKHLQNGIYAYVQHSERSIIFEAENGSKTPPTPIIMSMTVKHARNVQLENAREDGTFGPVFFWMVPNVKINIQEVIKAGTMGGGGGGAVVKEVESGGNVEGSRAVLLQCKPVDKSKDFSLSYEITYKVATIDDWLQMDEAKKVEELKEVESCLGKDNVSKLTTIEIQHKLKNKKFVDPEFGPLRSSLYVNEPPLNAVPIQFKRFKEFLPEKTEPALFKGERKWLIDLNYLCERKQRFCST